MPTEVAVATSELAEAINKEHQLFEAAARSAVVHAQRAGELLVQAKAEAAHGQWLPWVREHCAFSERTAQGYMRVYKRLAELPEGDAQRVAGLPLRAALAAMAEPIPEVIDPLDGSFIGQLAIPCTQEEFTDYVKRLTAHTDALCDEYDKFKAELKSDSPMTIELLLHVRNIWAPEWESKMARVEEERRRIEPTVTALREESEDRILEIKAYGLFTDPPEDWQGWRPRSFADVRRRVKALPDDVLNSPVKIDWTTKSKACDVIADVLWGHWTVASEKAALEAPSGPGSTAR